jgi:hypothetical protein
MKKSDVSLHYIYAGVLFLLLGLHLRVAESFVLSANATRVLASWTGPPAESPRGVVRQIVIDTAAPRQVVSPPRWLGWASLSVGVVLAANGLLRRWRK